MKKQCLAVLLLGMIPLFLGGCGKRVDAPKSVEQVKIESEKMSLKELEVAVKVYSDQIKLNREEMNRAKEMAKSLSAEDLFGEKGEQIKKQLTDLKRQMSDLKGRHALYSSKYTEIRGNPPPLNE